jgi:hypothetical protein
MRHLRFHISGILLIGLLILVGCSNAMDGATPNVTQELVIPPTEGTPNISGDQISTEEAEGMVLTAEGAQGVQQVTEDAAGEGVVPQTTVTGTAEAEASGGQEVAQAPTQTTAGEGTAEATQESSTGTTAGDATQASAAQIAEGEAQVASSGQEATADLNVPDATPVPTQAAGAEATDQTGQERMDVMPDEEGANIPSAEEETPDAAISDGGPVGQADSSIASSAVSSSPDINTDNAIEFAENAGVVWNVEPLTTGLNAGQGGEISSPVISVNENGIANITWLENGLIRTAGWNETAWGEASATAANEGAEQPADQLAVTSSAEGTIAVWRQQTGENTYEIRAAQWDGSTWTPLGESLNALGGIAESPEVVSSAEGVLAAWCETDERGAPRVLAALWDGSGWQLTGDGPLNADDTPVVCINGIELITTPEGVPTIAWVQAQETGRTIEIRQWSGGEWVALPSIPEVEDETPGDTEEGQLVLSAGANNTLYASVGEGDGAFPTQSLTGGGAAWTPFSGFGDQTTIQGDAPSVTTSGPTGDSVMIRPENGFLRVWYRDNQGGVWQPVTDAVNAQQQPEFAAGDYSAVIGADGAIYVAWRQADNQIFAARYTNPEGATAGGAQTGAAGGDATAEATMEMTTMTEEAASTTQEATADTAMTTEATAEATATQ